MNRPTRHPSADTFLKVSTFLVSCGPIPAFASDACYSVAPERLCEPGSTLRGEHQRLTTYIGLAANGRTAPNKLLEQADAAMALAANTSYASTR